MKQQMQCNIIVEINILLLALIIISAVYNTTRKKIYPGLSHYVVVSRVIVKK